MRAPARCAWAMVASTSFDHQVDGHRRTFQRLIERAHLRKASTSISAESPMRSAISLPSGVGRRVPRPRRRRFLVEIDRGGGAVARNAASANHAFGMGRGWVLMAGLRGGDGSARSATTTTNRRGDFRRRILPHEDPGHHPHRRRAHRRRAPADQPRAAAGRVPLPGRHAGAGRGQPKAIADVLHGRDDRLVVVVGRVRSHDHDQALEYGHQLRPPPRNCAAGADRDARLLREIRRATVGWKGLHQRPVLDGNFAINEGWSARAACCSISPRWACRWAPGSSTLSPQYISTPVSWGAISARTTEPGHHARLRPVLIRFQNSPTAASRWQPTPSPRAPRTPSWA